MTEAITSITNRAGVHARPAAMLVQVANNFKSKIWLEKGPVFKGDKVNAKSIMGIITLGASYGTAIKISAEGEDEDKAITAIKALFESRFEEE